MPSASLDKSVIAVEIASSTVFLNFYNSHAFLFLFFHFYTASFPACFRFNFRFCGLFFFFLVLSRLFPPFSTVFFFFQCSISAIKPDALELNVLVYFFLVLSNVRHHCCLPRSLFFSPVGSRCVPLCDACIQIDWFTLIIPKAAPSFREKKKEWKKAAKAIGGRGRGGGVSPWCCDLYASQEPSFLWHEAAFEGPAGKLGERAVKQMMRWMCVASLRRKEKRRSWEG